MCAWRVCLCGRAHVPPWLLVPGPSIKDESWAPSCGSSALPGALFSPCVPCEDVVDGLKRANAAVRSLQSNSLPNSPLDSEGMKEQKSYLS